MAEDDQAVVAGGGGDVTSGGTASGGGGTSGGGGVLSDRDEEISRLEEQAASFLVALRRTEKRLAAKCAESTRLEAQMAALASEIERQKRQKERYRLLAAALPTGASGGDEGGMRGAFAFAEMGSAGTNRGAVLMEARRELDRVKQTHAALLRQLGGAGAGPSLTTSAILGGSGVGCVDHFHGAKPHRSRRARLLDQGREQRFEQGPHVR